jgi:predicted TIM-barrel fold metal-dependent hydrolase
MQDPCLEKVDKYIALVKDVQSCFRTYDVHIHPMEVFFGPLDYREDPHTKGLFAVGNTRYKSPSLSSLKGGGFSAKMSSDQLRMIRFFLARTYSHSGPKVFCEYFDMIGIDRGLLLPVAPEVGSMNGQMAICHEMFRNNERFRLAGSVPNGVGNDSVNGFLRDQVKTYNIAAVKIHPNITGINLGKPRGKERLECIIDVSSGLDIPVIIHGGRSDILKKDSSRFAEISHFKDIGLKSSRAVVIAHGGAYGIQVTEVIDEVLPVIKKLLNLYENLYIDISGLSHEVILQFLQHIGTERILFGSDALYENQIIMIGRLIYALENSDLGFENSLIQMLSQNAANGIFGEDCAKRTLLRS